MTTRERRIIIARALAARKLAKAAKLPSKQAMALVAAVLDILPESGFCVTFGRKRIEQQPT